MDKIQEALDHIKEQIGEELQLCDYFTGLSNFNGLQYFNVELKRSAYDSVYNKLERIAGPENYIKQIQPNGVTRVAVFI